MLSALVAVDLTYDEALRDVMRVLRFIKHVDGDVSGFVGLCHQSEKARRTLGVVVNDDQLRLQYLFCEMRIDDRALPTGGAAGVALNAGLAHISDSALGWDYLRHRVREVLLRYPPDAHFALEWMSQVVCDAWLGCAGCCLGEKNACTAVREGWL